MFDSALAIAKAGHQIVLVGTAQAKNYYCFDEQHFKNLALDLNADFFQDADINDQKYISRLKALEVSLAVSVNWPRIINSEVCSAFHFGILNAHAGDLPRYRGNACPNWAILNGESHVGLTIHFMEPGVLDSGPVLLKERLPLTQETYIGDVYQWLEQRIPAMFCAAADGLATGELLPQPQPINPELALRCYPRRSEDARIDWQKPAEIIHRLIRASSQPFSGAFTFLEGNHRVTIWRAELFDHPGPFLAVPGQILLRQNTDPVIACGDGTLKLTEITIEGMDDQDAAKREISRSLRSRLK